MKRTYLCLALLALPLSLYADEPYFCAAHNRYIQIGMTMDQVIAACGHPTSQAQSNEVPADKIEVQQLIFNDLGTTTAFYGVWNMNTGERGVQLQVDIIDDKVSSIKINGGTSNAFDMCGGVSIQVGDPSSMVYNNCGTPTITNNTYILKPQRTTHKPIIFNYDFGPYKPPVSLTFVNGQLQSINQ